MTRKAGGQFAPKRAEGIFKDSPCTICGSVHHRAEDPNKAIQRKHANLIKTN